MKTIVKASGPQQFLSVVPRMFGFTPVRSAVVIPFAAGRSAGGMRVDLPPGSEVDAVAATLVGMVCRVSDADAYSLVVYGDEPPSIEGIPHAALAAALSARADACGLRTIDALYLGGGRWGSYRASGVGGEVAELDDGPADDLGVEPVGDQDTGAALPEIDLATTERTAAALHELTRAMHVLAGLPPSEDRARIHPEALAATVLLDDVPGFFDGVVGGPGGIPAADAARAPADAARDDAYARAALIWCLERPALRDVGLLTWIGGLDAGDEAVAAQLRWENGEEYSHELAPYMWGEGPRPDIERLGAALDACRRAAASAPRERRPGPLAACAWLAWALGRSTHAAAHARSACEIEPEHGLAGIVMSMVQAGHLPDWAFRP